MQGLMVVVCGEGFQQEIAQGFVWSRAFRAAPARTYLSNRKAPIPVHPQKPELRNSNWAQVTSLLRVTEVGLRCSQSKA